MNGTTILFCEQLAAEFHGVARLLKERQADNGELLPHVFFGDLTRYILAGGQDKAAVVQCLENAMSSGASEIDDLICVSFVENIETHYDLEQALTGVVGNKIREEWARQHLS
ncbi:MAG TPA: hypothetical protein VGN12_12150 [Pirellulales bacterium]|jgi:hypothetical protein